MVGLPELIYAGSHGFDIRGPGGLHMEHQQAQNVLPELDEAQRELGERIAAIPGAHAERKRFAIAVHYRQTPEENVSDVEAAVQEVAKRHPALRSTGGKKIWELQPDIEWDKGRAVLWLSRALRLDDAETLTLYIGDDVTDEDAFRVLADMEGGLGIRVAEDAEETHATYSLRNPADVERFLRELLPRLKPTSPGASPQ